MPTNKEKFNKFFGFPLDTSHSIKKLADTSGIPLRILKQVEKRGAGAYETNPESVRLLGSFKKDPKVKDMSKKLSQEMWAIARVYGFIMLNPKQIDTGKPDRDLFEKVIVNDNLVNAIFEGGALTRQTKNRLVNTLQKTTKEEAVKDFENLQDIECDDIVLGKKTGNKFVNFFTMAKRLETTGNKGLSFFDLWEKKSELSKKKYIMNVMSYYKKTGETNEVDIWYSIMRLYYGAVNIFKPIIAMDIYCRFNPTSVLDMTMGWGGRLVGACALNIPKYTGIDLNLSLKKPYEDMVKVLKEHSTTKITLMFKDALKVNYNKLDYDLVLTSPPYYNIEIYEGTKRMSEEEWDKTFYEPLFKKSWNGLKNGGHYCLNVPVKVYDRVLVPLLGKADQLIPMTKLATIRPNAGGYKEYIYVWQKTNNKTIN